MSDMEPSTSSQSPSPEPTRTDATNTFKTPNAPAGRRLESMKVPGLVGNGPILPEWLRKPFRRMFARATR